MESELESDIVPGDGVGVQVF